MTQAKSLNDHVRWIEHRGKQIIYVHYRGLNGDEMIQVLELLAEHVTRHPSKVLGLLNIEEATFTSDFMARLKQLGKDVLEPRAEKVAIVGVTGLKMIFINAYNAVTGAGKTQKFFANEDEAKAWLTGS